MFSGSPIFSMDSLQNVAMTNPDDLAELLKHCLIEVQSCLQLTLPEDAGSPGSDPDKSPGGLLNPCRACGDPDLDPDSQGSWESPSHCHPPFVHNNNCQSGAKVRSRLSQGQGHQGTRGRRQERRREARAVHKVAPDGQLVREEKPPCTHDIVLPVSIQDIHQDVLQSGAVLYSACRDYQGAETVLVFCQHPAWQAAHFTSAELAKLMLYYHSLTREEDREKGLTVIVDARGTTLAVLNMFLETLYTVEANQAGTIYITHVLADRVAQSLLFRSPVFRPHVNLRIDLVTSIETLFKFVPRQGLPPQLGGSLHPKHYSWCRFRLKLEPFLKKCQHAAETLVSAMQQMASADPPAASAAEASRLIEQQHQTLKDTLGSPTIVELQNEGETVLSSLHQHRQDLVANENFRSSVETAGRLYSQLDVTVKKLVQLAGERVQQLEAYKRLKTYETQADQIVTWISNEGEEILKQFDKISENLKGIRQQQKQFEKVYYVAMTQLDKANDLLEEAKLFNESEVSKVAGVKDISKELRCQMDQYSHKLENMRERIENTSQCYHLLDKSYEWALGAMKYAASVKMDKHTTSEVIEKKIQSLDIYMGEHPPLPADTFDMMLELAKKLDNDKLYEQCEVARTRCLETDQLLQERSLKLKQVKQRLEREQQRHAAKSAGTQASPAEQGTLSPHGDCGALQEEEGEDFSLSSPPNLEEYSPVVTRNPRAFANRDVYLSQLLSVLRRRSYAGKPSAPLYSPGVAAFKDSMRDMNFWEYEEYLFNEGLITEDMSDRIVAHLPKGLSDSTLRGSRESLRGSVENLSASLGDSPNLEQKSGSLPRNLSASILQDLKAAGSVPPSPSLQTSGHRHKPPHRKMLKKAASCSIPDTGCASPDVLPSIRERRSNKSISMITGSNESLPSMPEEEETSPSQTSVVDGGTPVPASPAITTERKFGWSPVPVNTHLIQRQQPRPPFITSHSMADLRVTEEEVKRRRTLSHILHEMIQTERDYVKSLQFVIDNYLPEMFKDNLPQWLRGKRNVIFGNIEKIYEFHSQKFLKALESCQTNPYYVSRCFLDHDQDFFLYALYNKNKPKSDALMAEYGMAFFRHKQVDLGDRMDLSSYLLKPVQRMGKYSLLLKQIIKECSETEPEYNDLVAAMEMVKFQLRHGNDLLAMDCLKACDVNLQEQGMLLRQDEFLVWQGRKKSFRHVFLFEEMVLFSKTKRTSSGSDLYTYKNSIKTSDLGLTENISDSRYKFEIWFRKRTASDTYVLQAPTMDVKNAWVKEISMLLWKQAFRNRERRLSESARMGIGRKPCMDLKPSKDNIHDRFINVPVTRQVPRTRNSIAISSFDHLRNGSKRPHSLISVSSSSSGGSSGSAHSAPSHAVATEVTPCGHVRTQSDSINSPKMYSMYSSESGIEVDLNTSMMSAITEDACTQTTLKRHPRRKGQSLPGRGSAEIPENIQVSVGDHPLATDV